MQSYDNGRKDANFIQLGCAPHLERTVRERRRSSRRRGWTDRSWRPSTVWRDSSTESSGESRRRSTWEVDLRPECSLLPCRRSQPRPPLPVDRCPPNRPTDASSCRYSPSATLPSLSTVYRECTRASPPPPLVNPPAQTAVSRTVAFLILVSSIRFGFYVCRRRRTRWNGRLL